MTIKIIAGKRYNTDTAELLGGAGAGYVGDFAHWHEDLYRTKKGNFFLDGEGGPMSRYAVSEGNNTTGGSSENIIPLNPAEAAEWLEEHDWVIQLEKYFPDQIEDA